MIPAEYIGENKRLKYSYIFSEEKPGELQPWVEWGKRMTLPKLLQKLLPYSVTSNELNIEVANDLAKMTEIENWIGEHCHNAWQLWFDTGRDSRKLIFMFENLTDATIFKLAYS